MIESSGAPGLAGSSVVSRSVCFGASVEAEDFFRGDRLRFRARFGDENGFLLATPPGPAGRGFVGELFTGPDDVGVEVLCADKVFCRMSSQLSGRITRIRMVVSEGSRLSSNRLGVRDKTE